MQTTVSVSCPVCISNLLGCSWLPIMSHVVGFKVEVSPIMVVVIITDPLFTSELCTFLDWWNWIASFPGHLPGHLPLHFLECICDLWTIWRSWRRPSTTPTSSNCKVDLIMMYVDLVSVIIAIIMPTPEWSKNSSGFLVSYCWLLLYRGGPLEVSGTDLLVVLLLQVATVTNTECLVCLSIQWQAYTLPVHHCSVGI